jgi:hypothetical protein
MVDYLAVDAHFDANNMAYFTFYTKFKNSLKAVIRQLAQNTPAEDILWAGSPWVSRC